MVEHLQKLFSIEHLQKLFSKYGKVAIATYAVIYAIAILGFAAAIRAGFEVQGTTGTAGALGAGYVAAKVAMPVRVALTVALTPIISRIIKRIRGNDSPTPPPSMGSGGKHSIKQGTQPLDAVNKGGELNKHDATHFSSTSMSNSDESQTCI